MAKHILFYDFETSGMIDFRSPSVGDQQPHIVQCAAKLINAETRDCAAALNVLARQEDWNMEQGALDTHGITKEKANALGFSEYDVSKMLYDLWLYSSLRVGHNESFDARIMRIALKRYHDSEKRPFSDVWAACESECTMRMTTPICRIPSPTGRGGYKWPRLTEAYHQIIGKELEGAHDAMVDVDACIAVYFAIQDMPNDFENEMPY